MSVPKKFHHAQQSAAADAVNELMQLANVGNAEAVEALRNIAIHAIDALESLRDEPTARAIAATSHAWPAKLEAVKELRVKSLERWKALEVGSAIGIRLDGKRGFAPEERTGLAYELFREIEAARNRREQIREYLQRHPDSPRNWRDSAAEIPPLSRATAPQWVEVAIEYLRENRIGDWTPVPEFAAGSIGRFNNGSFMETETVLRDKLKDGFQKLA